ncbi:hypothetical protein F5Y05DRAFT_162881 [Hypoxylon sp. FL0543]|nr:hypothetical protein F5Y05DRAFT_162881 [Hypoxylon sp. FL0543]
MKALRGFPLFSRLPAEIRLMVWEYFSLTKPPTIHIYYHESGQIFSRKGFRRPKIRRSEIRRLFEFQRYFSTTRSLMQVNREARGTVLSTLQLYKVPSYSSWQEGILIVRRYRLLFINWEKDVIWYPDVPPSPNLPFYTFLREPSFKRCVKNIAFEIRPPYRTWDMVSWELPSYVRAAVARVHALSRYLWPDFEALHHLQLVIAESDLSLLYRKGRPDVSGLEDALTSGFPSMLIPISAEEIDLLLEDDPSRYSAANKWRKTTLQHWVDKLIKAVSPAISEKCKRKIDIQVVVATY